jgi:NCAIR mutase (PurE)-related protein
MHDPSAKQSDTAANKQPATADLGEVQLDLDRAHRCGYPEAVFAQGKTVPTLVKVFHRLLDAGEAVLATRVTTDAAETLIADFPQARYNPVARTLRIEPDRRGRPHPSVVEVRRGRVAILTAGTTDLAVAEEARETAEWMGAEVVLIQDVGVAGPHRLPARLPEFQSADAIVVVAGMEGALPSVVGGYVACPVIAVPTSVGYGASFGGIAALLGMLNSCAANVTVVNIDAGFKGGYVAALIANAKYK